MVRELRTVARTELEARENIRRRMTGDRFEFPRSKGRFKIESIKKVGEVNLRPQSLFSRRTSIFDVKLRKIKK